MTRQQHTAWITGAGSGIGLALAELLVDRGVRVALVDRDREGVEAAAARLNARRAAPIAEAHTVDVTDRDAVRASLAGCAERWGRLDYVVNNAGVGVAGELRDTPLDDWVRVMDVNVWGVVYGVEAAYPILIKQGFGRLINVASIAGLIPLPGEAAYGASKYAVVGLSQTLRAEAAALGVQVHVACPGIIDTAIYATSPVRGLDRAKAMALWPRGISPERCAAEIMRGVDANVGTIVITPLAKSLWRLHRFAPRLYARAARRYMRLVRTARVAA